MFSVEVKDYNIAFESEDFDEPLNFQQMHKKALQLGNKYQTCSVRFYHLNKGIISVFIFRHGIFTRGELF